MKRTVELLWNNPYLRFLILIIVAVAAFYLLRLTAPVWSAFLISFLLADLLNPALEFFARRSSRLVGMLAMVGIILLILLLLTLLGLYVSTQASRFSLALPVMTMTVQEAPFQIARRIDPKYGTVFEQIYTNLKRAQTGVGTQLGRLSGSDGEGGIASALSRFAGAGGQIGVILILTIYLLYGYPSYVRAFVRLIPHRYRGNLENFVSRFALAMGGYIRGQIIVSLISGVLVFVAMLIIGVPLAPLIGIVYALANFIPYFGPLIAAIPTLLLSFLEGGQTVILALLALLVVNQLDGNFISPYVFSKFISLDGVTVIIALLLGGVLFGFAGVVLAIPFAAFLKVMVSDYYINSTWYKRPPQKL